MQFCLHLCCVTSLRVSPVLSSAPLHPHRSSCGPSPLTSATDTLCPTRHSPSYLPFPFITSSYFPYRFHLLGLRLPGPPPPPGCELSPPLTTGHWHLIESTTTTVPTPVGRCRCRVGDTQPGLCDRETDCATVHDGTDDLTLDSVPLRPSEAETSRRLVGRKWAREMTERRNRSQDVVV